MQLLRIKQIEFALRGGRLEDAFQRLKKSNVLQHRRGQELKQELAAAFVARAEGYVESKQLDAAAVDCQRAADLAGQQEQVVALRNKIESATRKHATDRRQRNGLADQVRSMIRRGDFVGGQKKLDELSAAGGARGGLEAEIERKQSRAAAALERAKAALASSDDDQAITALLEVQKVQPNHPEFLPLQKQVVESTLTQLNLAIREGRLDQAIRLLNRVRPLGSSSDAVADAELVVGRLSQASCAMINGDLSEVHRLLKQITQLAPQKSNWLQTALADASAAAQAIDSLQTGPLGLMQVTPSMETTSPFVTGANPLTPHASRTPSAKAVEAMSGGGVVPDRFLIQADGVGSYLVVRKDQTRLGPASSSRIPDVELHGMNQKANVRIDRLDEDYFLRSDRELSVNSQPKSEALLADGDVIALGKRCRGKFRLPSATTGTAMLEFSGTSFLRRDIRGVLLLDDAILVGPGRGSHIRIGAASKPVVLYMRGETLCCRGKDETIPIAFGQPFMVGETSLVCTDV